MADSRIPTTIPAFNSYIGNSDDYQLATRSDRTDPNWKTLGWTLAQSGDWTAKRTFWRDTLYKAYDDATKSTSIVKEEVRNFIKDFHTFGNPLLDIMAANTAADTTDERQMKFKKKSSRKKPVRHKDPITETCFSQIKQLGGSKLKFGCSTVHDSKRKSVADTADGVLVSFTRIDKAEKTPTLPNNPNECDKQKEFSGASFVLDAGDGNSGDKLVGYTQWNDSKNPGRLGPYGEMFSVTIL